MRKHIATLNVYVDNSTYPGVTGIADDGQGNFTLTIRPKMDKQALNGLKPEPKVIETIIAHELGHFLRRLFDDPTHNRTFKQVYGRTPGERAAWESAKQIKPDLDPATVQVALGSYQGQ